MYVGFLENNKTDHNPQSKINTKINKINISTYQKVAFFLLFTDSFKIQQQNQLKQRTFKRKHQHINKIQNF